MYLEILDNKLSHVNSSQPPVDAVWKIMTMLQ